MTDMSNNRVAAARVRDYVRETRAATEVARRGVVGPADEDLSRLLNLATYCDADLIGAITTVPGSNIALLERTVSQLRKANRPLAANPDISSKARQNAMLALGFADDFEMLADRLRLVLDLPPRGGSAG